MVGTHVWSSWMIYMAIGLKGPNPGSMLISQTNPYTTGPFYISPRSTDQSLTQSSMGDARTKFQHPEMVVMLIGFF